MYRRSQRWMLIINNRFLSLYDYNFLLVIEKIRKRNSKICGSQILLLASRVILHVRDHIMVELGLSLNVLSFKHTLINGNYSSVLQSSFFIFGNSQIYSLLRLVQNKTLSTFPSLFLLGLHTNLRISCFSFLFFPCVS